MFALIAIPALLLLGLSNAAPATDPTCSFDGSSLMPCFLPAIMWAMGPEGQQIQELHRNGREEDFSQAQLASSCRVVQSATTCIGGYLSRCIPQDVTDVHTLIKGTVKLLEVCDKPDLLPKTKLLTTCGKQLKNNTVYEACTELGKGRLDYLNSVKDPNAGLEILRSGRVLKDICCTLKDMQTCMAPVLVSKCTTEAIQVHDQVVDAIEAAYGCAAKTAGGCPAAPTARAAA